MFGIQYFKGPKTVQRYYVDIHVHVVNKLFAWAAIDHCLQLQIRFFYAFSFSTRLENVSDFMIP